MNVLVDLAARAEGQPPPPGSGRYSYIHTTGRHLATDQTTDGRILDARFENSDREFWLAEDGSGRIEETLDGRPSRMSGIYGPGELHPGPLATVAAGADPVPYLRQSRALGPVGWITDIKDLWLLSTVPPALQARLLRHLATHPGLRLEETTDRAGRPGLAVSADDQATGREWRGRHVLVLDPETGMLLAAEQRTLQRGKLPSRMPDPDSYTSWVRAGYAPDSNTRP
jgi:hypothetical protein